MSTADQAVTDQLPATTIDDTARHIRLLADRLESQAAAGHMPDDPNALLHALSNAIRDIRDAANTFNIDFYYDGMPTWQGETAAEHLTEAAEHLDYFANCFDGSDD